VAWLLLLQISSDELREFQSALEIMRSGSSYGFTFEKGKSKVSGSYVRGVLYLKQGDLEVARGADGNLVKTPQGWAPAGEDPRVAELLLFPPPHTLVDQALGSIVSPRLERQVYEGELESAQARRLMHCRWFRQDDQRQWTDLRAWAAIKAAGGSIQSLQYTVRGKILPSARGFPSKIPKNPNPRSMGRFKLSPASATVTIRFHK
jgi:hypothetical protein